MQTLEESIDSRIMRRIRAEDRALTRLERREARAEKLVGTLIREGKEISYIYPQGGRYKEGRALDLVAFLVRNNYV